MANTAPKIPLPKTVTSIIASKIPGKDIMPSINRIITARTAPLSMAADAPIMLPASAPTVTEHTPTSRAQRDASMIRLRTSRPNWSVPKRCAALGSANRFSVSIFSGSAGIQKNEMIHIAAMLAAMIAPAQKDTLCFFFIPVRSPLRYG